MHSIHFSPGLEFVYFSIQTRQIVSSSDEFGSLFLLPLGLAPRMVTWRLRFFCEFLWHLYNFLVGLLLVVFLPLLRLIFLLVCLLTLQTFLFPSLCASLLWWCSRKRDNSLRRKLLSVGYAIPMAHIIASSMRKSTIVSVFIHSLKLKRNLVHMLLSCLGDW